jgi:hypothetical protein
MAGGAGASTLLARMSENTYTGINLPPLHSSANFAFGAFSTDSLDDKNAWQLGPLSAADVGHTFSLTSSTAANYPPLDWDRLVHDMTYGGQNIVWLGFGRPTEPVTSFSGLEKYQLFQGFHAPTFTGDAYVPSLNGYDFTGYQFDRFELTLNSLGFRHDSGFYWIDANFEVNMFGEAVPEPAAACLFIVGAIFTCGGIVVRQRRN